MDSSRYFYWDSPSNVSMDSSKGYSKNFCRKISTGFFLWISSGNPPAKSLEWSFLGYLHGLSRDSSKDASSTISVFNLNNPIEIPTRAAPETPTGISLGKSLLAFLQRSLQFFLQEFLKGLLQKNIFISSWNCFRDKLVENWLRFLSKRFVFEIRLLSFFIKKKV